MFWYFGYIFCSICPKGWQLPQNSTIVGTKSYSNLLFQAGVIGKISDNEVYAAGGFEKLVNYPMSFFLTGRHDAGTGMYARGSLSYYWSRSSASTTIAHVLRFNSSNVLPRYGGHPKTLGFSIRCVAL